MATGEASDLVKISKGKIKVVEWDASEIDPDADMYMLHRVQKSQLMKEKKLAARQNDDAAESRFK